MSKRLFSYTDYRAFIGDRLTEESGRGGISRLADAIQCQRSHLSRVLSGRLQLTMDQAYRCTQFFNMGPQEEEYFLKLVEWDRSGDARYRKKLQADLARLAEADSDLAGRMRHASLDQQEKEMIYYASWHWSAIHIITSIPRFQTAAAIAQRLGLPLEEVERCLGQLAGMGLVQFAGKRWKISTGSLHLSKRSPLNPIQHGNWRAQAVLSSQNPQDSGVHYTVVQTVSREDFQKLKDLMLGFIDQYARIANPSKEEELICFTCDLFQVGRG